MQVREGRLPMAAGPPSLCQDCLGFFLPTLV